MYIVYYWDNCKIVGKFLNHCKFSDYGDARIFAKQHKSKVERI